MRRDRPYTLKTRAVGSRPASPERRPVPNLDLLPDVRDGLTRLERVILWQMDLLRKELGRDFVPSAMLWGRVAEHLDVSQEAFQAALERVGKSPR